jgi:predicted GIY-YIG superfamily endonuclease
MYSVYIIEFGQYSYVGMTNNFFRRIRQHNGEISGGAKYTQKSKNWSPICIIDGFINKSEAMQCEWKLKSKRSKLSRQLKGGNGRVKYLNLLLKEEKWTSGSPMIKDQGLKIYILDEYKKLIFNNEYQNIELRELYI